MKNILITGATGFIGRAVCETLRTNYDRQDYRIIGTTRSNSNFGPQKIPLHKIDGIGPNTNWSIPIEKADVIIHLAARVHVMREKSLDPLSEYRNVNTDGTLNLAKQAAAAGTKRFIYLSTAKVGGPASGPGGLKETDRPDPHDAYSISKWEAEIALMEIAKKNKMDAVIIRPPLVYGPGVKGNFKLLANAVVKNVPLPLAAIDNLRSFIFVYNLADVIAKAVEHPLAANQIFFVSDNQDISTPKLIEEIGLSLNKKPLLFHLPVRVLKLVGAVTRNTGAIERLLETLTLDTEHIFNCMGWSPPFSMRHGLRMTMASLDSNNSSGPSI